ncbi:MAG: rhamnogalacturonan acetylesterase [Chitinophagaceae bacterium]|nr:MAG: rhamnogalacturonan acetylesterase [Chitinophagaceae bacterium]
MHKKWIIFLSSLLILCSSFVLFQNEKPTIYIIGDSTVRNSNKEQWGWGTLLPEFFDTTRIAISNQAMAGRSTRTFIKEGRWDRVLSTLKKGDYVMMQFGHNEGSKPDTTRGGYRGVLRGTGEDSVQLTWPDGKPEVVHSYGWYIRKFVQDAKAKGATPIVLSMIPRNQFNEGKVRRADKDYGQWAKEIADAEGVLFIDLNTITANKYDALGPEKVKAYFPGDHTHTNQEGARVNAASVVDGIRTNAKNSLNKYLLKL